MALKQGAMTVNEYRDKFTELSRYAPREVENDEEKQDHFMRGLHSGLRLMLLNRKYDNFQELVDRALLIEHERRQMEADRKRKFGFSPQQQNNNHNRPRYNNNQPQGYQTRSAQQTGGHPQQQQRNGQGPVQAQGQQQQQRFQGQQQNQRPNNGQGQRASAQAPRQNAPNNAPGKAPAPAPPSNACFRCGMVGHYAIACPNKPKNQSYGKVNHVKTETAEESVDVVYGTFPVASSSATVLFDTGASHSFISSQFALKNNLATQLMNKAMVVKSPGGTMRTNIYCPDVSITIRGVAFPIQPIVLESKGDSLDVILGMSWLKKWQAVIQCSERKITLVAPDGKKVETIVAQSPSNQATVNQLSIDPIQDIKVVNEFPDVFPDDLPGMPPDRDIEFLIELLPGTAPISKRPYRMSVDELEELKKQLKEL